VQSIEFYPLVILQREISCEDTIAPKGHGAEKQPHLRPQVRPYHDE
jgi:hypothetical protein